MAGRQRPLRLTPRRPSGRPTPFKDIRRHGGLARPAVGDRRNRGARKRRRPVQVEDHAQGARRGSSASPGRAIEGCGQRRGVRSSPARSNAIHSTPNSARPLAPPVSVATRRGRALGPPPREHFNGQQDAHRRHPSGGDPGGGAARQSGRGIRLRVGEPPAAARQYLSRQGHAGRAVAAGRLRRLRRQPPRLPGVFAKSIPTTTRSRSPTGRR